MKFGLACWPKKLESWSELRDSWTSGEWCADFFVATGQEMPSPMMLVVVVVVVVVCEKIGLFDGLDPKLKQL